MEIFTQIVDFLNGILWTYVLVAMLITCAVWFTIRCKFVQITMLRDLPIMFRNCTHEEREEGVERISSFQAFAISIASRVGTGNLAGVAVAIALGGPGAVFWMWLIAFLGAASAFVESTLAQLYKIKGESSFIGGPAYYMSIGLKKPWMGAIFSVLLIFTFGFAFNSVQSNTICQAFEEAFAIPPSYMGTVLTLITAAIIFGGIQSIARVSSIIVPFMALGYIALALVIIIMNITEIPAVFSLIISHAFGWEQGLAGGVGAAIQQGIRRGLYSNEAGMGSAPNVAATADVSHPVKQGKVQAISVFSDTLIICSCTAFIILLGGIPAGSDVNGIKLTQLALSQQIGPWGNIAVAVAIFCFAFSSVLGNYYYGEANVQYLSKKPWVLTVYRVIVAAMVLFGSVASLSTVWNLADLFMGMMTICNLIAIVLLGKYAFRLLEDYRAQKRQGITDPTFSKDKMPDIANDLQCWD
ncbi:MAG: alanine:cation symporter family protein [Akkermansiaceae bacterium]|nr:alanine:cation symporter family protein [Akkermansiaceae bacterium]